MLVGGLGTRLRPLTNDTPKQMLPVAGRPMIEWVAEHLGRHGVVELVLALGYRADALLDAYPAGEIAGVAFSVAVEPEPRGTAGAVRFAADTAGVAERCVVVNGDVLTDLDVSALIEFHESVDAAATIALQAVDDPSRFGAVDADPAGRVRRFVEKPPPGTGPAGTAPHNLVSAGTYVLEPAVIDAIPTGRAVSIERETFPGLVEAGTLYARTQSSYWLDTGTPQQYLTANLDVLEGRRPSARVAADQRDDGARVRSSAVGPGCTLGRDAVVVRSVVMADCVIGEGAVVADSILGPGVSVGAASMLTDCTVVGPGERIAAGEVLRAARRPEPAG